MTEVDDRAEKLLKIASQVEHIFVDNVVNADDIVNIFAIMLGCQFDEYKIRIEFCAELFRLSQYYSDQMRQGAMKYPRTIH